MKIENGFPKPKIYAKSLHVHIEANPKKGSTIIIALSGGPDSVYLMHRLKKLEKKLRLKLIAAHLNHGTRPSSNRDELFCKNLCKKLEIPFESKKVHLKGVKSFEDTARTARYAFFDEVKKKYKADFIATAHHLNDSIETILLNLTRGCSLQGLTGIKDRDNHLTRPAIAGLELRNKAGTANHIIRPLANLKKAEILAYLKKHRIKFVVDPTNAENTFARNKVRNLVLPVLKKINPGIEKNFAKNIEHFRKISEFLKKSAGAWLKEAGSRNDTNFRFPISQFKKLDEVMQAEILTYIYKENTGGTAGLTTKQIENALVIILKNKNLKTSVGKVKLETSYGTCTFDIPSKHPNLINRISPPPRGGSENPTTFRYTVKIVKVRVNPSQNVRNQKGISSNTKTTSKITIFLDADKLDPHFNASNLTVRTWQPGDRFQPLGMKRGSKKLQDFFTDKKIPRAQRSKIPIFLYKNEIIAVGTLTVNEKYKITGATERILRIAYK